MEDIDENITKGGALDEVRERNVDSHVEVEEEEEEELDDLFGDDDDDDNTEKAVNHDNETENNGTNVDGIDNDSDGFIEKDENDEDEDGEEIEEANIKQADIIFQRHPRSHKPKDNHALNFPLPRFLFADPEPFAPNVFEKKLLKEINFLNNISANDDPTIQKSIQFKKLEMTNTIRWRYAKTESGDLYKQSNSNIIEWEDGSMSLKLGNDYYDIKLQANDDNILAFQNNELLSSLVKLDKSVQVLPVSTKSNAHKFLANTIAKNMQLKKAKKINSIVTNEDPELKAREIERAQKEIEKARRRHLMKLQMEEEQNERRSNSESSRRRGYNDYDDDDGLIAEDDDIDVGDDYGDDENDFIVGDEENDSGLDDDELDKAAERLKQVKRDGAAKYRNDENDDEEEEAVIRKKRKVVLDDDDE